MPVEQPGPVNNWRMTSPNFLFAYHGGKQPDTSEETEVEIERWRGWFDRIGPAIFDPGNPVGAAKPYLPKA